MGIPWIPILGLIIGAILAILSFQATNQLSPVTWSWTWAGGNGYDPVA